MRPTTLSPQGYLDSLRSDAERMLVLAEQGLDVASCTCPGWTVADVLVHTGQVYRHKVANMRTMAPAEVPETAPGREELLEWFRASLAELVAELVERGPDAPSSTWFPGDQTVGFWYRRMAQETAVHRTDVEAALEDLTPVPADLAVDGVDEMLRVFLPATYDGARTSVDAPEPDGAGGEVVAVRSGDRTWRVRLLPATVEVEQEPGTADAMLTGEPSDLLLWLWGRAPDTAVRVSGMPRALSLLRARLHVAAQ